MEKCKGKESHCQQVRILAKKPIHLPIHPAVCFLFIIMMKGATALAQQIQPTRSTTANEPGPRPFSSRRGRAQIVCVTSEMSKPKDKSGAGEMPARKRLKLFATGLSQSRLDDFKTGPTKKAPHNEQDGTLGDYIIKFNE